MISAATEITKVSTFRGWIFYDRDCRFCSDLALRFENVCGKRGFRFEPLQQAWVHHKLKLSAAEALEEMRVLTCDQVVFGGADAVIFLAGKVWWMSPLSILSKIPTVRATLISFYRWVAAHRQCRVAHGRSNPLLPRTRWLGLIILPLIALLPRPLIPPWMFMWTMAFAIFFGCKWLTFCLEKMRSPDLSSFRAAAYLFAWPGMDAGRFLSWSPGPPLATSTILRNVAFAVTRIGFGALFFFAIARRVEEPLLAGWIGMIGMILLLHFGLFQLASVAWRAMRIDAPPIMDSPLRSTSLGEFWGRRWNGAFNQLAFRLVFRPVARRTNPAIGTLAAFFISGVAHELVISLPANGGYGLPTAYFLLQGIGVLAEHTRIAKRLSLGRGVRGWFFTLVVVAGPAFWLFHPPFVQSVILPFMEFINAL